MLCFKWDRFIREPLDLEYLIPRFDKAGVRFAEVDGNIDLGTDSGRLHARILIAVAKAEQERKAERQKLANEAGGGQRQAVHRRPAPVRVPRGSRDRPPGGGPGGRGGVRGAAGRGDGQRGHAGVDQAGADAAAAGPARHDPVEPGQHPQHLAEPADRGPVGLPWGDRRPGQMGAAGVGGDVAGGAGRPGGPVPQAAAGGADAAGRAGVCPCGNVVAGGPSHTGHRVYRCSMPTRDRSWPGGHVARQAEPVEEFIEKLVVERLSRADAADLVAVAGGRRRTWRRCGRRRRRSAEPGGDGRRPGAGADHPAADCSPPPGGRTPGWRRSAPSWTHAARENVLAPLVAAENAAAVWAGLDLSRKRAVIKTLMSVTLHSPGRGAPPPVRPGHGPGHLAAAGRRLIPASDARAPVPGARRGGGYLRRGRRRRSARVSRCWLDRGGAAATSRAM